MNYGGAENGASHIQNDPFTPFIDDSEFVSFIDDGPGGGGKGGPMAQPTGIAPSHSFEELPGGQRGLISRQGTSELLGGRPLPPGGLIPRQSTAEFMGSLGGLISRQGTSEMLNGPGVPRSDTAEWRNVAASVSLQHKGLAGVGGIPGIGACGSFDEGEHPGLGVPRGHSFDTGGNRSFDSNESPHSFHAEAPNGGFPVGMLPHSNSRDWALEDGPGAPGALGRSLASGHIGRSASRDDSSEASRPLDGGGGGGDGAAFPQSNKDQLEDLLSILASQVAPVEAAASSATAPAPARKKKAKRDAGGDFEDESDDESQAEGFDEFDDEEASDDDDAPGGKRKRKGKPTAEAKAEMTKQRNREHARSTRRRKKQYVEQLKKQVAELLAKQQQLNAREGFGEGAHGAPSSPRHQEQVRVKTAVLQAFLLCRVNGTVDRDRWRDIVDDHIRVTLPQTPYRATNVGEKGPHGARRLKGVESLIRDCVSVARLVDMIRRRAGQLLAHRSRGEPPRDGDGAAARAPSPASLAARVEIQTHAAPEDVVIVGDRLMCHWKATTRGLADMGFDAEVSLDGLGRATFHKNKLRDVELSFDALSFTRQLQAFGLLDLGLIRAEEDVAGDLPPAAQSSRPAPRAAATPAPRRAPRWRWRGAGAAPGACRRA
ncbi:hypothetical protein JL720_6287 [Aureococcus anophagefferens]|nr:hypothetical protein JL720_6287 [Aureococcus anophagefferens]